MQMSDVKKTFTVINLLIFKWRAVFEPKK